MSKFKLWLLRKWLRLLPEDELISELGYRQNMGLINDAYEKLSKAMIATYFLESKVGKDE